jgi:4-hydroxy-3-methylbut-2-en-1-yl diphosphate reductase
MRVEIDNKSGFCFGVVNAVKKAEDALSAEETLYSLGDIVHNGAEVHRLAGKGMKTISREEFYQMKNCRVLIRAHGEPPETYAYAKENNIEIIDATCPIVLAIQKKVRNTFKEQSLNNGQLVIFGKPGHAEVVGLNGQTGNTAIIISHKDDLDKIDFNLPVTLYSQTTKPLPEFREIADLILERAGGRIPVEIKDTVCRQVSGRAPHLEKFAARNDVVIFVSGKKSSNGAVLFDVCKKANRRSHMVSDSTEIQKEWFLGAESAGICGATSTPQWLMEEVACHIESIV